MSGPLSHQPIRGVSGEGAFKVLRIDYGDGRVIRGSSTKIVISQLWTVIIRHAIHHYNAGNVSDTFNSIIWRYGMI